MIETGSQIIVHVDDPSSVQLSPEVIGAISRFVIGTQFLIGFGVVVATLYIYKQISARSSAG